MTAQKRARKRKTTPAEKGAGLAPVSGRETHSSDSVAEVPAESMAENVRVGALGAIP
jgi:hypothetical protein